MYEFKSRVRYSELNSKGQLAMPALLDYFQDCSTFHSEDIGLGLDYMEREGLIWAMAAWQIDVSKYPVLGDEITIGTAPYEFKGFIGYRNFWMDSESKERIAVANSTWSLICAKTGKPVVANQRMREGYAVSPKIEMEYLPRKISFAGKEQAMEPMTVLPHNLDTNQHVNNGQFIRIAMDYLDSGFRIGRMRAEYKKQAKLGDVFFPRKYETEQEVGVSLQDETGHVMKKLRILMKD